MCYRLFYSWETQTTKVRWSIKVREGIVALATFFRDNIVIERARWRTTDFLRPTRSIASVMRRSAENGAAEFEIPMVKLLRAHGGCLGIERR